MAPSTSHISTQLRQLIYYHLDNNLVKNALFLAGRLHAYEPRSSEASYLLALCHLLSGQPKAAWEYSRNSGSRGTHVGCSYVYAQACLDLGKHTDGITALERSRGLWSSKNHWNKHSETRRQHLPDAAAVLCLQGKLWQAHKDLQQAVECYVEALKLNPFMWDAFLGLCEAGVNIRIPNIYRLSPELVAMLQAAPQPDPVALSDKTMSSNGTLQMHSNVNFSSDTFFSTPKGDASLSTGSSALWERLNGSNVSVASVGTTVIHEAPEGQNETEDTHIANGATSSSDMWDPPLAPARRRGAIQVEYGDPAPKMRATGLKSRMRSRVESEDQNVLPMDEDTIPVVPAGDRKRTVSGQVAHPAPQPAEPGAPQRRSTRLLNHIRPTTSRLTTSTLSREGREVKKVRATGARGRTTTSTNVGRVVSGNRKTGLGGSEADIKEPRTSGTSTSTTASSHHAKSAAADRAKEMEALSWILDLFCKLATAYYNLTRYKCQEAIQAFNQLPQAQRETPWVLSQIGRAYYEQALYSDAEKYFIRVKALAPSRLDDMEIYSTVQWHLKNEVELSYLAHELMEVDRLSPQAWCAVGNAFSHQRDHEQALKCFKRATQLDPRFAYAFALQGHEHVANEEYDKALDAFRKGVSIDSRHYNSWYGLGQVYEKMGKLDFAEQHYRNAVQINPSNAVLICCMGLVIEKLNNPKTALFHYSRATTLAPRSVLARFRKARVLMKMNELKLALAELKVLKDLSPDEANVHYLLGKIYKMLHDKANAIKHFTTALNLDPKAAQYIKDAMEALDDEEEDDADMA